MKNGDLESLPNIGKAIADKLRNIGIKNADDFLKLDPYVVFEKLKKKYPDMCRCALAAIVGANTGMKWHTITKKTAKKYEEMHPDVKWENC